MGEERRLRKFSILSVPKSECVLHTETAPIVRNHTCFLRIEVKMIDFDEETVFC